MNDIMYVLLRGIVCVVGVLVAELLRRVVRIFSVQRILAKQLPGPPASSLILGNLREGSWVPRRHRKGLEWAETYGPDFRIRFAWINVAVFTSPDLVSEVLHNRDFDKVFEVYRAVTRMMSDSGQPDLVSGMTDDTWRLFRKGLAPAFNPVNIRHGFKHTAAACAELMAILKAVGPHKAVDIDEACLCETMDVLGKFGFGHDFEAVKRFGRGEMAELMHIMHKAELEVERRLADPTREHVWWLSSEGREGQRYFKKFQTIMRQVLSEVRSRLGANPPESDSSIGAHMLRLRDPKSGEPLPDDRLLPNVAMMFFAGHDTTGHTMAWTLFHIANNPEVEARIAAELQELGLLASPQQPAPRPLQHEDLAKLTYLSAAIKESMRLTPAVGTATIRVCDRDVTLGGGRYRIPAGTGMWTPIYAIHNSKISWGPDADQYKPERWLEKDAEYLTVSSGGGSVAAPHSECRSSTPDSGSDWEQVEGPSASKAYELGLSRARDAEKVRRFIPFSDGRRDCIGQAFARMNYTAAIATLLSHFHFELAPEMGGPEAVYMQEEMRMTLQPGKGLLMHCHPRAGAAA